MNEVSLHGPIHLKAFAFKVCSCFQIWLLSGALQMTQMTYILKRLYILTALAEMDFNFEFPLKCLQPWKQSAGDKLLSRWQRTCCRRQATFSRTAEKLPETSYFLADSGSAAGDRLLSRWQRKSCWRQATFSLTAEALQETSYFLADSGKQALAGSGSVGLTAGHLGQAAACCLLLCNYHQPPKDRDHAGFKNHHESDFNCFLFFLQVH